MSPAYDVIVVRSGPAVATAAYTLGEAGRRVLVLEKARLPGIWLAATRSRKAAGVDNPRGRSGAHLAPAKGGPPRNARPFVKACVDGARDNRANESR